MNAFTYHLIGKIERDIVTIWFKTCPWKRFRAEPYQNSGDRYVRTAWGWMPLGIQWQRSPEALKPLSDRNMAIFNAYQSGISCGILAREHGCSTQRIHQIVAAIAHRSGEEMRPRCKTTERILPPPRVIIPQDIIDRVNAGTLSLREAARICDCAATTIGDLCPGTAERNRQASHKLYRTVYDAFIAGAQMKDLAALHNTTIGNIGQIILKARRLWNLPGKRKIRKETRSC